ncbi:MAG: GatB/YqeY domain-containing protein [Chromatiales bacterium]|jgi:uncharacterized protein YqeY|nr:GatB/YqeY domain-containing protein [Chromatiales bacterium]
MSLKARLTDDMKQAMRAGDKPRLAVIRMGLAAIKQREVDDRIELDDTQVLSIIEKMIKQRRESVSQFRAGNREDLAEREEAEITVLQAYLPEPLSEGEVESLIEEAIQTTGASSMRDMGNVMSELRAAAHGRVDMAVASARVKSRLARN